MGDSDNKREAPTGDNETVTPPGFTSEPRADYTPHPLFPREDGGPEDRNIHFVTFFRRRCDGQIDVCREDIPADEIRSWAEVMHLWGGGAYLAVGKDKAHQPVAAYPPKVGVWMMFDGAWRPFTDQEERRAIVRRTRARRRSRQHRNWRPPPRRPLCNRWRDHVARQL